MFFNTKKFGLSAILSIFVFVTIFGSLFFAPRPARAQMDANITNAFRAWQVKGTVQEVKQTLKEKAQFMFMTALMNGLNYFANKIAYDMGVWLASGDWGQGPFSSGKSFGSYMAQVAGDSLGEMLGSLSEDLGLNLCDLPDLRLDLALQLGFHFAYNEPKPKCSWQQLRAAYNPENVYSKYASREGLADRIGLGVNVKDTDMGIWFKSKETIDAYTEEQVAGASGEDARGEGISAMTEIISGKQVTPAAAMKQEMLAQTPSKQQEGRAADTRSMTNAALQKGATTVALNAVSTFVNTLLGTVVNNFVTKGMLPGGKTICNPGLSITGVGWNQCADSDSSDTLAANYYTSGSETDNRRAAQELFSELLAPKITTLENYDLATNMAECSEDNKSPDACVIDQSFMQILQQADLGDALTIKQAMERGLLHGDWKLISPNNAEETDKWTCAEEAYCYRNIKFLRQARILPVGFEMAAYIANASTPPSLSDVVNGFYDESSAYYHLINPQWVIKMPKMRCASYAYGAVAQDGVRVQECVDLQHCVGYNKDGTCQSWGYCMKEKPVWKFDAGYCDSIYSTCKAFTGADGDASYLTRTLDTTECNSDNVGCARYSRDKYYVNSSTVDWYSQLAVYNATDETFTNTGIHFNKSVSTCSAENDGCSAFKLASDNSTLLYLKKAPDYLGCYDADPSTAANSLALLNKKISNGVQWPMTLSGLNLIQPQDKKACANYAQVCLPEEVNCNYYTASYTGEKIPAKFTPAVVSDGLVTWNDQCDAVCNGYAAYQEMPSNYSSGQNLSYIIPSSGNSCIASQSGCTAFTNLNANSGGMEQKEYFSYLRLCALPDQTKQKNYTVYESSESGGYSIKTYTLVKNDSNNGPKQIFRDADEYAELAPLCSQTAYEAGTADPDCHQFIGDDASKYYAFLSKTIIATDQCTPYRLSSPELIALTSTDLRCAYDYDYYGVDRRAGSSTVEFKSNACYYMGTTVGTNGAGDTRTCNSNVESCRAYKGNAGNNVRLLLNEDFENADLTNWGVSASSASTVTIATSTESTQIDGHSLRVNVKTNSSAATAYAQLNGLPVTKGKAYTISFWAKGSAALKSVSLASADFEGSFTDSEINSSDVWKYYSFGPLNYNGSATTSILYLPLSATGGATQQLFIDNIRLTEVADYIYLVKNSLSVNALCDSDTSDNLPGEALGCTAYSDPLKNMFYLTGFNYLCREAAVGCTAVLDTYNTPDDPNAQAYNVWIAGASGGTASATVGGETFTCQVPTGETGCYTDIMGYTAAQLVAAGNVHLTSSTIYIPPDTTTSTPIYLVANQSATCKAENLGCEVLGKSTVSASGLSYKVDGILVVHYETFEETAVLNNPALYSDTLCKNEEAGCSAWTSGDSSYYFKKPNATCTYKTDKFISIEPPAAGVEIKSVNLKANSIGWVMQDTGICVRNELSSYGIVGSSIFGIGGFILNSGSHYMGRYCATDADCVIGTSTGTCKYVNQVPCYPASRKPSGEYQLWSSGNPVKYYNYVGTCPQEQSGCTEYVDHSSSDNNVCAMTGEVCTDDSDCETEGDTCVANEDSAYYLIDNEKLQAQEAACNGQVSQAEGCALLDNTNNPNKYWNTTSSYALSTSNDENLVTPVDKGNANDANTILKVKHDRECAEWAYCDFKQTYVDSETNETASRCYHLGVCQQASSAVGVSGRCAEGGVVTGSWLGKDKVLDKNYYQSLYSSWDSIDLSGYSIPFTYQIPDLRVRNVDDTNRLVYVTTTALCTDETDNGSACGSGGACYNGECLFNYIGPGNSVTSSRSISCRSYPEDSSPFSTSVLSDNTVWGDGGSSGGHLMSAIYKTGFENTNLCYDDSGELTNNKCDCSYDKFQTSGGDIFTQVGRSTASGYVCSGGSYNGKDCDGSDDIDTCGTGGTCSKVNSVSVMTGWQGYCMEKDLRQTINGTSNHRCLTWWPLELAPGTSDIWATDPSAGYEVGETDDRYMCLINAPTNRKRSTAYPTFNMGGASMQADWGNSTGSLQGPNGEAILYSGSATVVYNSLENSIVTGCWDTSANAFDAIWGLSMSDGDDSQGKYCPINKNTLKEAGSNLARISLPVGQTYLQRNDIERIDVYLDKRYSGDGGDGAGCSDGWVSFYNDLLDENEDQSFIVKEWFRPGCTNSSWRKKSFGSTPYSLLTDWYSWQWEGGNLDGDGNWVKDSSIVYNLQNDTYASITQNNDSGNGTGIRIIFDSKNNFRGIWVDGEDNASGSTDMGFFFVITLRDGRCAEQLQISDEDDEYFGFKPFTGRLALGDLSVGGDWAEFGLSATRTKEMDNPNYGLNSDSSPRTLINPFVTLLGKYGANAHSPQGISDPDTAMTIHASDYDAGVPLSVMRVQDAPASEYARFYVEKVSDCAANPGAPYCQMLKRMFARVYSDRLLVRVSDGVYAFKDDPTTSDGTIVVKNGTSVDDFDSTADAANPATAKTLKLILYPPRVAAPTSAGYEIDAVAVNGQTSGNVYLASGATAAIQFYAWASPNQMPLRRVAVRKGDGTDPVAVESESLSNKKPSCNTKFCDCNRNTGTGGDEFCIQDLSELMPCSNDSDCDGLTNNTVCSGSSASGYTTFGSTSDTGCKAEPYDFIVDYSCPMGGSEGAKVYPSSASTYGINWNTDIVANFGDVPYVCAFQPKVQVLDNWGWCTSRAPGTNGGCNYSSNEYVNGYGCYAEDVYDYCALSKSQPWVLYGGYVVVVPM
ncbi:MAG: carbohydrate binding domain-containing protein [Patescibacteria group bacterium]